MIKSLIKDVASYLPSRVIAGIVIIASFPIFTRLFSPADYGNYILVIATITILEVLVNWVHIAVVRFYPAYKNKGKSIIFTRLILKLAFLSIGVIFTTSSLVLLFLRNYLSKDLYRLMSIGLFGFVLTSLFLVLSSFLRVKRSVGWYSILFSWKSIATFVFGVLVVALFHLSIEAFLWSAIITTILALPILWKKAVGKISGGGEDLPFRAAAELAKYSIPLVIADLAEWILSFIDRYMLQLFRGAHEVGIYSISYQISDRSIWFFISLFHLAFSPLSIAIWEKKGKEHSKEFVTQGTRYFLLFCIPAVVGLSFLREPVIKLLSTSNYYQGARVMPLILSGVFFLGLIQRFNSGLIFYKKTHLYMYSLIGACVVNVGLNLLLIPKYGYIASAVTTLISYVFLLLLTIFFSRRFFRWKFPFQSLAKAIFASAIMGTVIYYLDSMLMLSVALSLVVRVCVGAVVYFISLLLLWEFKPNELKAMLALLTGAWAKKG